LIDNSIDLTLPCGIDFRALQMLNEAEEQHTRDETSEPREEVDNGPITKDEERPINAPESSTGEKRIEFVKRVLHPLAIGTGNFKVHAGDWKLEPSQFCDLKGFFGREYRLDFCRRCRRLLKGNIPLDRHTLGITAITGFIQEFIESGEA
jgi:hypothetical protein